MSHTFPHSHSSQLNYQETLQEGAGLRIPLPHSEGGFIDLEVGVVINTALKVLQPTQINSNIDSFYRQQAWKVTQVFSMHAHVYVCMYMYIYS